MSGSDLLTLLDELLVGWEHETVEFKEASNDYKTDRIGEYFSALSNEANLRGIDTAWLVFGVSNKTRRVVGTDYRVEPERLQSLKMQIADNTEPSVTFRSIREVIHPQGRIVMMEIPPAPVGIPIAWKGHYHARAGESLTSLGLDKLDLIRRQSLATDWSAGTLPDLTLEVFDPGALTQARRAFAQKHPHLFSVDEVMDWPVMTFTDRAKLTLGGRVTRAGLLLVGRAEASGHLSPHPAQLTWGLVEPERAYEHFSTPFVLSTTGLYDRIRNVQLRLVKPGTLLAVEVPKYDRRTVLEALHNAIAHQDYMRGGRVLVQEYVDRIVIINEGGFFEGTPEEYATGAGSPTQYRNPLLAQAMVELGMIDTLGYGIFDMHRRQMGRFLPMPDYDLSRPTQVRLTIHGAVIDEAYTDLLMARPDMPLGDAMALDHVQKGLPVTDEAVARLRQQHLVRGRRPHLRIVAHAGDAIETKAGRVYAQDQGDLGYLRLIVDCLADHGTATRADIDQMLSPALPAGFNTDQKSRKVANLLTKLRREGHIHNTGSRTNPTWALTARET